MALTRTEIETFIRICEGHKISQKETFARLGKKIAREIAKLLELETGTYNISYNKAGSGVLGDLRLHTDSLYLTLEPSYAGDGFMYRSCKSRKDYVGGRNQWADYDELYDIPKLVQKLASTAKAGV